MLPLPEFPRGLNEKDRTFIMRHWLDWSDQDQARWAQLLTDMRGAEARLDAAQLDLQRQENALHAQRNPRRWAYIAEALKQATYKPYSDGTIFGDIPALHGVFANAPTQEACEVELAAVADSWITARLRRGLEIPIIAGMDLNPRTRGGARPTAHPVSA